MQRTNGQETRRRFITVIYWRSCVSFPRKESLIGLRREVNVGLTDINTVEADTEFNRLLRTVVWQRPWKTQTRGSKRKYIVTRSKYTPM